MKKKLLKIAAVLLGLFVIALVVIYFMLGSIIKKGVETVGPDMTQGDVKLESANLSIFGSGGVNGVLIGNPKNAEFTSPFAFKLGSADVKVQVGSLMSDKIIVESIIIDGAEVCFEGLKGTNHKKIMENIEAYTGGASEEEKPEEAPKEGEGKKVVIKLFRMTNTKVLLHVLGITVPIPLPDFEKKGIGEDTEDGASLKDTVAAIYGSLYENISGVITKSGDLISNATGKAVDALKDGASSAVDKAKKGLDNIKDGAADKLKGLFD